MSLSDLSTVNASLNALSTILLLWGYIMIKKGEKEKHKKLMIMALVSSTLFLICYITYHYTVGSIPYPYHDWTRPVYFAILIPHVILAVVMTPLILRGVWLAIKQRFEQHRRLMRWVWPIWL